MKNRTTIKDVFSTGKSGQKVTIAGWLRTKRDSKTCSFLEINDGSCLKSIQVVVDHELPDFTSSVKPLSTGASILICGQLAQSPGKEQSIEVQAETVAVLGESTPDYVLQKKRHSNEFLRTIPHLRPRTNTFGAVFRLRSTLSLAIHSFFNSRGFVYLHTPIITTSDCEGAGEMFRVTTLNPAGPANSEKKSEAECFAGDFFGQAAHLTVSGQLEAEAFACALSRIYTFGPTFRAENSNTPKHLAEFWMVEPEMAFCDLAGDMQLAEDFIKYITRYCLEHAAEDMEFFDAWIEKGIIASLNDLANSSFEHLTYTEAIEALQKSGKSFEFKPVWGADLQTEHERYLTEELLGKPVFVTNYPKTIKPFYMKVDEGGKTVSAMDLLVPRLGEIIGGSERESDLNILLARMKEMNLDTDHYSWYCDLRRFGTVPHAGFGLGLERMLMYISGMSNIRDVIASPRTPGSAIF
ncbi:MAG: asparagine--tRNA ligase [bacterium]|nr:asparagine--tRNA ligase [bacterium]